jgi:hypothetical protein
MELEFRLPCGSLLALSADESVQFVLRRHQFGSNGTYGVTPDY